MRLPTLEEAVLAGTALGGKTKSLVQNGGDARRHRRSFEAVQVLHWMHSCCLKPPGHLLMGQEMRMAFQVTAQGSFGWLHKVAKVPRAPSDLCIPQPFSLPRSSSTLSFIPSLLREALSLPDSCSPGGIPGPISRPNASLPCHSPPARWARAP